MFAYADGKAEIHMKKYPISRLLSLLLTALMLCACLAGCVGGVDRSFVYPERTLAGEETYTFGSYTYQRYDDGTAVIVDYGGSEQNLVIPDSLDGYTVVAIGGGAFMNNPALQSVKLNKNLEMIEAYAFCACTSLTQITFGQKVWRVGEFAFDETPWLSGKTEDFVVVGDGLLLKYQGQSADVVVPEGVKHIGPAFAAQELLVSVEMGPEVQTVGDYAFAYTPSLRRVVLGENVTHIGNFAFDGCTYLTHITLPDYVETVGDYAFNECNYLVDVDLGKSLRTIGQNAFKYCSRLVHLTMPQTVEQIGGYAFADCYSLTLVDYAGSPAQFEAMGLEGSNALLKDAHILYGNEGEK